MSFDYSTVCYVDCETAGLNPDRHPIWEIAVIVDDQEHSWTQQMYGGRMNWQQFVQPWVLENTRIATAYEPKAAMSIKASIDHFADLTYGRHIVGANPAFDYERLCRCWRAFHPAQAEEIPWLYRTYDVEAMTAAVRKREISSLRDCCKTWDVPVVEEERHTAIGDARLAKAIFEKIMA